MPVASLLMYSAPEPIALANLAFWTYLHDALVEEGISEIPESLSLDIPYDEAWLRADLVMAQTCGYPYIRGLKGRVKLVATPCYAYDGCEGPFSGSVIVVGKGTAFEDLASLAGTRVAINGKDSNSGMNLLRRTIAPYAVEGRFFSEIIETGGHRNSLAAVASNQADVAAIDAVTFGNLNRFAPDEVSGVRILARTPIGPGLPLITRGSAPATLVDALRRALHRFAADPATADIRDTLAIRDFAILDDHDYERLLAFEREAENLGYPKIA